MLEIMLSAEGEEGNQGATTSAKEAARKGGIENSPNLGKKRTASEHPGAKAPKRGKKSSPEGPASGEAPAAQSPLKSQASNEP